MNQSRWERLSGIYHAARQQPPEARSAYLDGACSGDPQMRAEIESLLRHDLPSVPALTVLAADEGSLPNQPVTAGTQIGVYRIERPLGAGGMGEVHLATDTRLNRPVALKFVSVAADENTRRRFQQETRAVSSLNHPHILTVHDSGQFASREYLVTEFVDGGTLKTWLEAAPRTWRQTVELLIGVADALAAAHDAGILHRDIKPANILVAQNGYAKLADFGLAKLAGTLDQETRSEPRTGAGVVVGTLDYMSPEQLSGRAVDRRSDIFSFGIVLYEALARRRPFAGATNVHVVESILHQAPAPLAGDIPVPLREAVAKALEKDPGDRYQSMRELVVDLRRLSRHSTEVPAVAAPSSRLRRLALAAAFVALAMIAGLTTMWWRSDAVAGGSARPPIHSIALVSLGNASTDPDEEVINDGIVDEISIRLANVHDVRVLSPMSTRGYKGTAKRPREIGRELGADAILQISMQRAKRRIGVRAFLIDAPTNTQLWADSFDHDADDVIRMQAEVAQAIVRELGVKVLPEEAERLAAVARVDSAAHDRYLLGRRQLERGDAEGIDKAVDYLQQAIDLQPSYAAAYAGLSWALQVKSGTSPPPAHDALLAKAIEAAQKALDLDQDLAEGHAALAGARFEQWDWTSTIAEYEKALALNPSSVDCGCYAYVLSALGQHQRAFEISRYVLAMNPMSIDALMEHAWVLLFNTRQYAEAERLYLQVLELEPRNVAASLFLSRTYVMQKEWDKALSPKAAGRPELRDSATAAAVYAAMGRPADAHRILAKTSQADAYGIALVELALGHTDRALDLLSKAVDDRNGATRWLNVSPAFDSLRSNPRFKTIVGRLKLPN